MKKLFFLGFGILLYLGAAAQSTMMTLDDALKAGLQHNYGLLVSRNNALIANNNNTLANANMVPLLNADGSYSQSIQNFHQVFVTGTEQTRNNAQTTTLTGGIEADWTIFDGLQMFALKSNLKKLAELGELGFQQSIENTTAQISSAYYDLVRQQQLLTVQQEAIKLSQQRLDLAKTRFEIGKSSKMEYLQAKVDLNADSTTYLQQMVSIQNARLALLELTGQSGSSDFKVADTIVPMQTLVLDDLLNKSKDQSYDLLVARKQEEASRAAIDIPRGQYFPQLMLSGRYNLTNQSAQAGFLLLNQTRGFVYGGTARWNLFNGGLTTRQIQNARIVADNAHLNYQQTLLDIDTRLRQSYQQYQTYLSQLNFQKINYKIAYENLDIAHDRYTIGKTDLITYRQAQVSYIQAHASFFTALYQVKASELELLRLSGQLVKK